MVPVPGSTQSSGFGSSVDLGSERTKRRSWPTQGTRQRRILQRVGYADACAYHSRNGTY